MNGNAKDKLHQALEEISCCENHLNEAYINTLNDRNKTEIHAAVKAVGRAMLSAQDALQHYED